MSRFLTANAPHIADYIRAFGPLQRHAWPEPRVEEQLVNTRISRVDPGAHQRPLVVLFADALEQLRGVYPALRVFWKDARLDFLGGCQALVRESGVGDIERFVGLNDMHEDIVWCRQGALYRRDDRKVMESRQSLFDILERQDVEGRVRWLRTSKAPVFNGQQVIGVIGAFDVIDAQTARHLAAAT